jgi:RimJ/RimL family protein N-acetyltransferase
MPGRSTPSRAGTSALNCYHLHEGTGWAYVGVGLPEEETWGQGYGTEALKLLLVHLLGELSLGEVRTATWTGNVRMVHVAEKCGFRETGRSRYDTEFSVRGEPLERIEFSSSRGEWLDQGSGGR